MPRSATDAEVKQVTKLIVDVVEPRIKRIVDEANEYLAKLQLRMGANIQWVIDSTQDQHKESTDAKKQGG